MTKLISSFLAAQYDDDDVITKKCLHYNYLGPPLFYQKYSYAGSLGVVKKKN